MLNLLKEFGMFHYLKFKPTAVEFGGEKVILFFLPHLVDEHVRLYQAFGLDCGVLKFLAGKRMGADFIRRHGIPLGKTLTEVVGLSCNVLNAFGWGVFRTVKVDEKQGFMVVEAEHSIFAEELKKRHGPRKEPVDWLLAGLFAGALEHYAGTKIWTVELSCMAEKDVAHCTFLSARAGDLVGCARRMAPGKAKWVSRVAERIRRLERCT